VIAGYVLIQTEVGMATGVAAALTVLPGVSAAASVAGPYDVIIRAEARSIDQLGRLVVSRVQATAGVLRTITCPIISRSKVGNGGP
jgi:DNA-binding Lrp family transcriptional regulator